MTSRASFAVSAMIAMCDTPVGPGANGVLPQAISRTHSAPVLVLPKPRPASTSQVCQLPFGANWFCLPLMRQMYSKAARSLGDISFLNSSCSSGGSAASTSINDEFAVSFSDGFEHFKLRE